MAVLAPFDNISDTHYFFLEITVGLNVALGFCVLFCFFFLPPSCPKIKVFNIKNNLF